MSSAPTESDREVPQNIALVGLIHVADVPRRNQPGTAELDYGNIYRTLAQ
jgi:hydroxypyruvate isomerase